MAKSIIERGGTLTLTLYVLSRIGLTGRDSAWKPTSAGGKCYTTSTASLAPAEKTQQEEEVHTAGNVIDSDTRRALGFARSSNN
eukprot:scaffold28684_cov13-Tisochrysis_lutea.AAC.1